MAKNFTEPLTEEEARCLLAHLPERGAPLNGVKKAKNPVLYLALWKLEWQSKQEGTER